MTEHEAYIAARDRVLTEWGGLETYCRGMFEAGLAFARGVCPATKSTIRCTRSAGHDGPHIHWDREGDMRWLDDESDVDKP